MRKGGGKSKGAEFERQICKKLSLWLSDGKREDLLWRSAMSGGRATVAHKKGKLDSQVGDISAVSEEGYAFTNVHAIECKSYANIHVESLLTGLPKSSSVKAFWLELETKAKEVGKRPILIFRQNRGKTYLLMSSVDLFELADYRGGTYVTGPDAEGLYALALLDLDHFLKHAKKR